MGRGVSHLTSGWSGRRSRPAAVSDAGGGAAQSERYTEKPALSDIDRHQGELAEESHHV